MKKTVGILFSICVFVFLAVFVNLCYFLIPYPKEYSSSAFWILYAGSMLCLVFGAVTSLYAFFRKTAREKVFGVAIFRTVVIIFGIQLIADVILFIVGSFVTFPSWAAILVEAVLLILLAARIIIQLQYQRTVKFKDEGTAQSTECIARLKTELAVMRTTCYISELKPKLDKLYEKLLYCDPVSIHETEETEKKLLEVAEQLKTQLYENNSTEAEQTLARFNELMDIRSEQKKGYANDNQV